MTIREILNETAKTVRLSGSNMRMFPTVYAPKGDGRPGWIADRENIRRDARAAMQSVVSRGFVSRDDNNGR